MAICKKIQGELRQVCVGDLNQRVTISIRRINPPSAAGDVDYFTTLTEQITVWSLIKTVIGEQVFDGSNIPQDVTHHIYIRYIPDITFEKMIVHKGQNFRILDVENLDSNNQFYLIRCYLRGDNTKPVNLA